MIVLIKQLITYKKDSISEKSDNPERDSIYNN